MQNISDLIQVLEDSWDLLAKSEDSRMVPMMKFLHERLENPQSFVTLVGETSSGKSTLINSFLKQKLLPAMARPTTGAVTCIEYGLADRERLYAINRDATTEELDLRGFRALASHPDENLFRLKAEIPGNRTEFRGLTMFDTPGFNSIISDHEEILKDFLPNSDVIVFAVLYQTGFTMLNQEYMSLIAAMDREDPLPVLLVINRVPAGVGKMDRRIREIKSHAEDTIHRELNCILVHAATITPDGHAELPDTEQLWKEVAKIAFSKEREREIRKKSGIAVRRLIEQRINEMEKLRHAILAGQKEHAEWQKKRRAQLENTLKLSYELIEKRIRRIDNMLPSQLDSAEEKIIGIVKSELAGQSDWKDGPTAQNFIYMHVIPFNARLAIRNIEEFIKTELHELDRELSEQANMVVQALNEDIQLTTDPELKKLITCVVTRFATRLAGETASGMIQPLAGVGGSAAAIGNLVKMAVKQIGSLFGKTFSRDVYTTIGKIFTKKAVQTMSFALSVAIEAIDYIWDAKTWKDKLIKETEKIMAQWKYELKKELFEDQIVSDDPNDEAKNKLSILTQIKNANISSVNECYSGLLADFDPDSTGGRLVSAANRLENKDAVLKEIGEDTDQLNKKLAIISGMEGITE